MTEPQPHEEFPPIRKGGSLILAWQIRNKKVLIVGGGNVAAGRIVNVLEADAKVTVISPRSGLIPEVAYRVEEGQVEYVDRTFIEDDLEGVDMCLTAIDDPEASREIYKLCKARRIPVNVADVPPECDFYFGSQHRDGALQIMVSTNGNGPKLANLIRRRIAEALPARTAEAIDKVGQLRRKLRRRAPNIEEGPKRMRWMIKVCDEWSFDELAELDEETMEKILDGYASETVPSSPSRTFFKCGALGRDAVWYTAVTASFVAGALSSFMWARRR
ncbi:siroheme synthase-like protein Met8 [Saitoella complicata NRRL Y-17804]|nr:siroheme synthase-like protein Met8 [Saitoella complicata NRRL Y-17804]ODQ49974.1 siroheme synthase-like protein Met8 [Saitoella complicata NRRL Y-17804]